MSEEKGKYLGEVQPDNEYQIRDEATPRDYYAQIPNIVDIMDLSPHAYRLYGHLRRVAGEYGKCWQSTKTLAKFCSMSAGKVSEGKAELESVYPPLIRIESKAFEKGQYHEIAVTDIWQINHDFFTGGQVTVKTAKGQVFHNMNEWSSSQYEKDRSQYETKNNPIKEKPTTADFSENSKPEIPQNMPMDWYILNNLDIPAHVEESHKIEHDAILAFEASFSALKPLLWYCGKPKWTHLRRDVVELYKADPQCFEKYKAWRTTPYVKGAVSLKDIQRDPDCFMASWAGFVEANPTEINRANHTDEKGLPLT